MDIKQPVKVISVRAALAIGLGGMAFLFVMILHTNSVEKQKSNALWAGSHAKAACGFFRAAMQPFNENRELSVRGMLLESKAASDLDPTRWKKLDTWIVAYARGVEANNYRLGLSSETITPMTEVLLLCDPIR